jgi:hypothetical protein
MTASARDQQYKPTNLSLLTLARSMPSALPGQMLFVGTEESVADCDDASLLRSVIDDHENDGDALGCGTLFRRRAA